VAIEEQLYPASFRGIPFIVESASTTGGAKIVTHEYPNSDIRYDENLGKLQKVFSVKGVVAGANYINERDVLLLALEDGSPGQLIHPWYGIHTVVPKPYTVEESNQELGQAIINMVFEISSPAINPSQASSFFPYIDELTGGLDSSLQQRMQDIFNYTKNFTNNFTAAELKLQSVSNSFDVFSTFFGGKNNTSSLNAAQSNFNDNIVSYINDTSQMAAAVSNLFAVANDVNQDPQSVGLAMQQQFTYGDTDAPIPAINTQTKEQYQNNTILNYTMQAYALIYAYNNYAQADFSDDQSLNVVKQQLEKQYQKLISGEISNNDNYSAFYFLGNEVLDQLDQLRTLVKQQFDALEINIDKITQIDVNTMPATIISYLYYSDVDEAERIIQLNDIKDVSFVSGNINALAKAQNVV
jgi:prophage DNA circulation protein